MVIVEEVIVIVIEDIVVTLIANPSYQEVRIQDRAIASTVESTEAPDHLGTIFLYLFMLTVVND